MSMISMMAMEIWYGPADKILDRERRKEGIMYTREQKEKALAMYDATQSIAEVIRRLGYPSKQALYTWIANRDMPWQKPNGFRGVNTAEHPWHPSVNLEISAIRTCFEERKIFLQNHLTKTSLCGILCRSAGMLV